MRCGTRWNESAGKGDFRKDRVRSDRSEMKGGIIAVKVRWNEGRRNDFVSMVSEQGQKVSQTQFIGDRQNVRVCLSHL